MEKQIGNIKVGVAQGDMTQFACDAFIVPQFTSCASFGGVGGAVARSGAQSGMDDYDATAQRSEQPFGRAILTQAGGGKSKGLLHVVSVGSGRDEEFGVVRTCMVNALGHAIHAGLTTIVAPAMGTGIIGQLTAEQSAKAMLSAVNMVATAARKLEVTIVIYGDQNAYKVFCSVLESDSFIGVGDEVGEREFDLARWVVEMQRDRDMM